MSQQIDFDRREDRVFLLIVLVTVGLGVITTLIALKALHLSFPSISLGQRKHRLSPPTSGVPSSVSNHQRLLGSPSASSGATNDKSSTSPTPSSIPSAPRPSQTHGTTAPTPTVSSPGLPTLPSLIPLPSFSISIGLPSPLPSLSLGLHP